MNYAKLQFAIKQMHGCESDHVSTVPVRESFNGATVWEGEVEVFDLQDHPSASRIYAWSHDTDDPSSPKRHVTVLHLPPAITPRKAVQVSIASDYREQKNAES